MSFELISILVLSEDGSVNGCDVVANLTKHALLCVYPQLETHRINWEPGNDRETKAATTANRWRSTSGADRNTIVSLRRKIASKLLEEKSVVVFHYDGDSKWNSRTNRFELEFAKKIRQGVEQILSEHLDEDVAAYVDDRLLCLVPYYSVESWLYQNTVVAKKICENEHNGKDVSQFAEWGRDRSLLDEVLKPKEKVCLSSNFNKDLSASHFPRQEVEPVGKSFGLFVEKLRESSAIRTFLSTV